MKPSRKSTTPKSIYIHKMGAFTGLLGGCRQPPHWHTAVITIAHRFYSLCTCSAAICLSIRRLHSSHWRLLAFRSRRSGGIRTTDFVMVVGSSTGKNPELYFFQEEHWSRNWFLRDTPKNLCSNPTYSEMLRWFILGWKLICN